MSFSPRKIVVGIFLMPYFSHSSKPSSLSISTDLNSMSLYFSSCFASLNVFSKTWHGLHHEAWYLIIFFYFIHNFKIFFFFIILVPNMPANVGLTCTFFISVIVFVFDLGNSIFFACLIISSD